MDFQHSCLPSTLTERLPRASTRFSLKASFDLNFSSSCFLRIVSKVFTAAVYNSNQFNCSLVAFVRDVVFKICSVHCRVNVGSNVSRVNIHETSKHSWTSFTANWLTRTKEISRGTRQDICFLSPLLSVREIFLSFGHKWGREKRVRLEILDVELFAIFSARVSSSNQPICKQDDGSTSRRKKFLNTLKLIRFDFLYLSSAWLFVLRSFPSRLLILCVKWWLENVDKDS